MNFVGYVYIAGCFSGVWGGIACWG